MRKAEHKTQQADVLEYLQKYGSITQMEAYRVFDAPVTRLAVSICELRKKGYDIETVDIKGKNCYGTYSCAKYVLKTKPEN